MNKNGQSLVLFVMLLPIFILLFTYLFDTSYIVNEKIKLNNLAKESLKYLNNDKDSSAVEEYILLNNKDISIKKISKKEIYLTTKIKPIFGYVVGYKYYDIDASFVASFDDGVLRIEEKG